MSYIVGKVQPEKINNLEHWTTEITSGKKKRNGEKKRSEHGK